MKRSPTHLTTWGTFVIPRVVPGSIDNTGMQAAGILNISAVVASDTQAAASASISATFELLDPQGATVATLKAARASAAAGGETTLRATGVVPKVDLWTGRRPALYIVRTRLRSGQALLDESNTSVGFRSLRFSADTGFHLNEQHFKVRGCELRLQPGSLVNQLTCVLISQSATTTTLPPWVQPCRSVRLPV